MKQQILAMLELQNAMNSRVNENWAEQHFAWYRAIWVECAELLDHYGWKWWKKQTPDANQVKLELVDIWHFGLSILLLESRNHHGDIALLVEQQLANAKPSGDFREDLEAFTLSTLQTKKFDVAGFGALMAGVGLSFDELYTRYVGKNVLNFFRQDHGYQDGSYRKQWGSKEDNEHLVEAVAELDHRCPEFKDDLYQALQNRYADSA
ncbi:MAG: dUTP diphosphatase [Porticoccus sp.]|jgi:dimeric dUTPase (all-alpha-NTP-PPase superfamily)|uniref:dUTP diphosphatase n=1 Tax=Porticoccus sp. TaxID=2024853 RepID=UPI0032987D59|tara:strand:- start:179985 stop:180605 length:621 start_codon:yes stop_codon:yes gene_type:complete